MTSLPGIALQGDLAAPVRGTPRPARRALAQAIGRAFATAGLATLPLLPQPGQAQATSPTTSPTQATNADDATPRPSARNDGPAAVLPRVRVTGAAETPGRPPTPYAGGQVGRGGGLGLLGDGDLLSTPFNQTSYTEKLIRDQQARTIGDVLSNDAGVRSLLTGNNETDHYIIRGFVLQAQDVAIDGLYGISPSLPPIEVAERIEVLKGPNALLGGMTPNGNVGGSINVRLKRADNEPLTRLTVGYTSDSLYTLHADVGRRFGPDRSLGIRVNTVLRKGDTAIDGVSRDDKLFAAGLDWRGERARVSLDLLHQTQYTGVPPRIIGIAPNIVLPSAPRGDSNAAQRWEYSDTEDTVAMLRGEVDITSSINAYVSAGVGRAENQTVYANQRIVDTAGNFTATPYWYPTFKHSKTVQGGLRGELATGPVQHRWNLAVSRLELDSGNIFMQLTSTPATFNSNIFNPVWVPEPTGVRSTDVPLTSVTTLDSVGLADTLSFADDRVQLTLGARRQSVRVDTIGTTGAVTATYDKSAVTPGIALLVKPVQNVALYANYIEGLSRGPTAPATAVNAGEVFPPFKSKQIEAGVKVDLGSFAITGSLYRIVRPSSLTDPVTMRFGMNGEQRNTGLELSLFGEPVQGVRVMAGATALDPEMARTANGTFDGKDAIGAPRRQANLGIDADIAALPGLAANARVIHTGAQYRDSPNTQQIPAWTRLDLGARYRATVAGREMTLRANVTNVLGKDYWSSALYGMIQGGPRTLNVSASMDF